MFAHTFAIQLIHQQSLHHVYIENRSSPATYIPCSCHTMAHYTVYSFCNKFSHLFHYCRHQMDYPGSSFDQELLKQQLLHVSFR